MDGRILILDFGSQYTMLIARRVREQKVYSEIHPYNVGPDFIRGFRPAGIILSGGPSSVYDADAPRIAREVLELDVPVLGICYGMQLVADLLGERSDVPRTASTAWRTSAGHGEAPCSSGSRSSGTTWRSRSG